MAAFVEASTAPVGVCPLCRRTDLAAHLRETRECTLPQETLIRGQHKGAGSQRLQPGGLAATANVDADRLASVARGRSDAFDRAAHRRRVLRFIAEGGSEIAAADEQRVDAVDGRDGVDLIERFRVLDLGHHDRIGVGIGDMPPHRHCGVAAGPGAGGKAALAAPIAAERRHFARIVCARHMRNEHTGGAAIEHRQDRIGARHPHQCRHTGGACREQRDVGCRAVERRMLLVDDDEVEAGVADDLGRMTGRRLQEGPDQRLARDQALAE